MGAALDADNTTVQTNDFIDLPGVLVSPCTGETVQFDGRAHIVTATTPTDGGFTLKYHFNTQSVSGVGLTTGTKYQISDVLAQDESAVFVRSAAPATSPCTFASSAMAAWITSSPTLHTRSPSRISRRRTRCRIWDVMD